MKLRRALWLCVGLSSVACGDDGSSKPSGQSDAAVSLNPDGSVHGGGDAGLDAGPDGVKSRTARVVSVAPSYLVVGDSYSYTPKTSTKTSALSMVGAPMGMAVDKGTVRWSPVESQAGNYRVTMRAAGAGTVVAEQPINIAVVKSTLRADGDVDDSGGSVFAQSPSSKKVFGMGAAVPAGALGKTTHMSVSELGAPPATPNAQGVATAVAFGPHGTVFGSAAHLTLGLPQGVTTAEARLGVYVYDPAGRWKRTPMVGIDKDNGLVMAKAQHFSVYAAIQSALDLDVKLTATSANSACQGALVGSAVVTSPLSEIELASVNNLSDALTALVAGGDLSVQDLLAMPSFRGSLRAVQVLDLVEGYGDTEVLRDEQLTVTTLYVPGDGSATITHADALGNVLASKSYAQPALALDDISLRMRGGATDATFAGEMDDHLGLAARVHLTYFEGDASLEPVSVDDLGMALVERGPTYAALATTAVADVDCDGLLEPYDGTDDSMVIRIDASPSAVSSVFTGDHVTLTAHIQHAPAGAVGSWTLLDLDGANLSALLDAPESRDFVATVAGRYLVSFRTQGTGAVIEHIFAIDVADRVLGSVPVCTPSAELKVGRVGEALALTGVVNDADTPLSALSIEWGLLDRSSATPVLTPASTILARSDKALFSPLDQGNFTIGCRAFDGMSYGPVGQVDVSVVPSAKNRSPVDLVLSPMASSVSSGTELIFHAYARDPDGDTLGFDWNVTGASSPGDPVTQGGSSVFHVLTDAGGTVKVTVSVSDDINPPITLTATVLVGDPPTTTVDADGDGWPRGTGPLADCDDNNPAVHPTAVDLCGDNIDSNCDGVIETDDCDHDGFGATNGDCDDSNDKVHPRAHEYCDGVDNDCNGVTDDNYSVGKTCTTGVGSCTNSGLIACTADGNDSTCTVAPLPQTPEICDGLDNDCDGIADDNGACPSDAGTLDAGTRDASVSTTIDADVMGTADTGVVQQQIDDASMQSVCKYSGPEICGDGIDNDCDGATDDKDIDCQQTVEADACPSQVEITPNKTFVAYWDGTHSDFDSSCNEGVKYDDLVYSFTLDNESVVSVSYAGSLPFNWSLQDGSCDDKSMKLNELYCNADYTGKMQYTLRAGTHYLILFTGGAGGFTLTLNATVIPT